jgi:HlyD family secretion protein
VRSNSKIWWLGILVGAAIGVAGLAVLQVERARESDRYTEYTTARVSRGEIVQSINAIGQLGPRNSVEVSSQISGLVTGVRVDFNSVVQRGQILATIDASTYEQRFKQATSDLSAAKTAYALAQIRSDRLRALLGQDLIPRQDYDEALANLEQNRATLLTRMAAVDNARVDLERCIIKSPIDGVVIYKQIEVGKTVVSSLTAPVLFTIAQDLSELRLIAPVSDVDVVLVRPGQLVRFTIDAFGNEVFEGQVVQVRNPYTPSDKQNLQQQRTSAPMFDVVVDVRNSQLRLQPSLTANVSIIINRRANVLKIPSGALRINRRAPNSGKIRLLSDDQQAGTVYRIAQNNENPEAIGVLLGASDGISTEVKSGLSEGDQIVTGVVTAGPSPQTSLIF